MMQKAPLEKANSWQSNGAQNTIEHLNPHWPKPKAPPTNTNDATSKSYQNSTANSNQGGLSKIEIVQSDGSIITHTSKHGIKCGCANQTVEKYSQTENTLPMTEPLLSHLGYLTETAEARQILNGSYNPPTDLDPYAKKFLEELRMPEVLKRNRIPANIPTAKHTQFWKGMDKRKGSEPSDLSHAHYKVAACHVLLAQFDASL
jgi:hypothetical protein